MSKHVRMSKHAAEGCNQIQEDFRVSGIQRQGPSCSAKSPTGHSGLFLWSIVFTCFALYSSQYFKQIYSILLCDYTLQHCSPPLFMGI